MGWASQDNYPKRVGDVEGVRRAALAVVTVRAAHVAAHDVPASLATSPLRNPYNDRPFEWDGEAVVFTASAGLMEKEQEEFEAGSNSSSAVERSARVSATVWCS